ncbi:MAG: redoxin domain-containing protein [Bacteroidales bacterium]|nr:redoxin domain-containing protein [Bacteroidales bacterium]
MKKLLLFVIALTLGWGLKAQCPLTNAVDFTATDCHGTEVHLFDLLDAGQYVLIDFFFTTCNPCQQATPKIRDSYTAFGCNMYDVFYMEISDRDSDAACINWVNNYGIEYPTISGEAGGNVICNQYQIGAFPTVILIAPDHSILINDLWPISNAQTIITQLEAYGIQQHDCDGPNIFPTVQIEVDLVTETEVTATFTPLEACTMYYYTLATEAEMTQWMGMTGLELPEYLQTYGFPGDDIISHTFTDLTPNTDYVIYAVPSDENNVLYEVVQEPVTTTSGGGAEIMPDFTAPDIDGNEINLYSILDNGQAVLIYFFLYDDPFSETPMPDVVEAFHQYGCNEHDVFFMEITPNGHDDDCQSWVEKHEVPFPTISRDSGGNNIVQAIPVAMYPTIMLIRPNHEIAVRDIYPPTYEYIAQALDGENYEQYYCATGMDENSATCTLFPNPANESVTLKGENLGTVSVYNAFGQKIEDLHVEGSALTINTANYESGIYIIKTAENTMRFMVKH